ncbi:response regulator transcription factor [Dyadobacter jiangsuensis]|uniref:response regulator transcription factor n=1 Tax=Dyadobacter jiangsuensis TaxID=1591085 RepID=UPI000D0DADAC
MRHLGYEVFLCYSDKDGIASAEKLEPDALIVDIAMPLMDGHAVCKWKIRYHRPPQSVSD